MKNNSRQRLIQATAVMTLIACSATTLAATGEFETSVAVGDDAVVEVSSQNGKVIVQGADVDTVTVKARINVDERYTRTDPQKSAKLINQIKRSPPVEVDGNRVRIGELKKHSHRRYASISYKILVPREATVNIRSVSGDVRVTGVSGEVNATSETGEVAVAGTSGAKSPLSDG